MHTHSLCHAQHKKDDHLLELAIASWINFIVLHNRKIFKGAEGLGVSSSREIAKKEGVSINQFISSAVSEKISASMTKDHLSVI